MASHHLPDELLYEILLRLPVESVLRFKTVCRLWDAWISDQRFAYGHVDANKNKNERACAMHCVTSSSDKGDNYQITYNISFQNLIDLQQQPVVSNKTSSNKTSYSNKTSSSRKISESNTADYSYYIGSCNGLICCEERGKLLLCNPTTLEVKCYSIAAGDSEDSPRYDLSSPDHIFGFGFGFGFDASTNTYKVVLLWNRATSLEGGGVEGGDEYKVLVCSFPTCCWRPIFEGITYKPRQRAGVLYHGALHWLTISNPSSPCFLFVVDLATEQQRVSQVPVRVATKPLFNSLQLGVLRGCLSLLSVDVVWIMNHYGVEDSWEKLFQLPRCDLCPDKTIPMPIWISDKGIVVLCFNEFGMVSYDIEHQKFRQIPTHSTTPIMKSWVSSTCANSLVLPP